MLVNSGVMRGCVFCVFFSRFNHWGGGCLVMFCYFFVLAGAKPFYQQNLCPGLFFFGFRKNGSQNDYKVGVFIGVKSPQLPNKEGHV